MDENRTNASTRHPHDIHPSRGDSFTEGSERWLWRWRQSAQEWRWRAAPDLPSKLSVNMCSSHDLQRCALLVLVMVVLLLLVDPASAGNKLRGIDPKDLAYFQGDSIWCKDGSKSFPRERLNDNFCDCPDGTDEPGTSACPAGKYYCKNNGSAPKSVFASRVNDGICDCCDGSDEYEKRVKCANTCGGAIQESKAELEDDLGQSTTLDISEDIPHYQQKKFGEDLVSRLKEMKAGMMVVQWLPLFSVLFLLAWMSRSRVSRRRKKSSRHSLV